MTAVSMHSDATAASAAAASLTATRALRSRTFGGDPNLRRLFFPRSSETNESERRMGKKYFIDRLSSLLAIVLADAESALDAPF